MKSWNRPGPKGQPLPAGSVYLVCRRLGRWVGDVLVVNGRPHVFLSDAACAHHAHVPPSEHEVAAAVAKATRANASVPLHVDEAR